MTAMNRRAVEFWAEKSKTLEVEVERLTAENTALRSQQAAVPAGYKLVPVEPTPEMVKAITSKVAGSGDYEVLAYQVMVLAAPQPIQSEDARDAALPIDHDADMDRYYIPVHPDWEIQTKGKGSSFRIANRKTGDRWLVMDSQLHGMLEQMARDIHAAMQKGGA